MLQAAHAMAFGFAGRGREAGRELLNAEMRKGAGDRGQQPRPFVHRRCAEQPDRRRQRGRSTVHRQLRPVWPVQQKTRRDDRMQRDDRNNHQRRELPADPAEAGKAEQLHGQPFAVGTASTCGVNM